MGSKQALSNGNEVEEMTDLLLGFTKANQVGIVITMGLENTPTGAVLRVAAAASNNHADPVVRARWASAHAVLPAKEYKNLMGLLTSLLYRLDFEIGEEEMRSIGVNRA